MNKSKVTVDIKRNRLQITLIGVVKKADAEGLYTDIRFGVADLKPGFAVINDFTQCRIGYLEGLGTFGKIREFIHSKGVGTVVRVVRKDQVVFNQLARIIDRNDKYQPVYVNTLEEAEEHLAEPDGKES